MSQDWTRIQAPNPAVQGLDAGSATSASQFFSRKSTTARFWKFRPGRVQFVAEGCRKGYRARGQKWGPAILISAERRGAEQVMMSAGTLSAALLLALCLAVSLQGVASAPVSVAMGIDLGTDNSVVALARKRGVDIVSNEASQRSTPSIVSFGHDKRYVGEAGLSQRMMNLKNTVAEPKRLLAKRFSDPAFLEELKTEPYEVVEGEGGEISVKVTLCGKDRVFRPVQIIAMLLANLKKIAEADHEAEVVDVAISVPVFFTEHQRRAILVAADIAGLKCLRLINDNTATALAYGITKTDLPEKEPRRIAFVDCGRDCMQVSIVAFTKGQLQVLSHTYSRSVGGRRIDGMLFDHFAEEFLGKHKIDVRTQDRARLRLLMQCEKLKKTLSACPEDLDTPINVECLMNDMDVSSMMNRLQLEELMSKHKLFDDIAATCEEALKLAGVDKEKLDEIELVLFVLVLVSCVCDCVCLFV